MINVNGYQIETNRAYVANSSLAVKNLRIYRFRKDGKCCVVPFGNNWLDPKKNGIDVGSLKALEFGDSPVKAFVPEVGELIAVSQNGSLWYAKQFVEMASNGSYKVKTNLGDDDSPVAYYVHATPLQQLLRGQL